jgi:D-3-phosphoglycerate dehydrogenase
LKILITELIHEVLEQRLTAAGFVCTHLPKITQTEVLQQIGEYNGLVVRSGIKVTKQLIDAAPNLKIIGRVGSGMELIDVAYAQQRGIVCVNSPEGNRDSVAEHALGMLLALMHNIAKSYTELKQRIWQRNLNAGVELMGKTIGIIGYGNMGSAFAQRLIGLGVRVIAHDKYKIGFSDTLAQEVTLNTIFEQADVVSLHLPLNPQTKHYINEQFITRFVKPVYLINTSRGGIADTMAIVKGLENGKLLGACLDVFENENLANFTQTDWQWFEALIKQHNVVLTPHLAGITQQSAYKIAAVLADKIISKFKV